MLGVTPPLPHCMFMAWCLVEHRDSFTLYFYPTRLISALTSTYLGHSVPALPDCIGL